MSYTAFYSAAAQIIPLLLVAALVESRLSRASTADGLPREDACLPAL